MSKRVKIGNVYIGNGEKIAIQSMTTTRLANLSASINAAKELEQAGCDIIRFSVATELDALNIKELKKQVKAPIVADIHFDYRLAIKSIISGADKVRINPGNLGGENNLKEVAQVLKDYKIPVRVGANTGSIDKEFLSKYGKSSTALVESALKRVHSLEKYGVEDIVISVKASSVPLMVQSYREIAKKCNYPLHIGVTEAGTFFNGVVKNSIGIGSLLLDGIGDTIRVSLSTNPVEEVKAAKSILKAVNKYNLGAEVVACPTCGRCEWDCMNFANVVEEYLKDVEMPLKVAVMGCAVNGPGEAMDSDLGIAGQGEYCFIFKKGEIIKKVLKENAKAEFFGEIDKCLIQK
jgi:(E)-4-hydroxy-3-methylbut-2-enyl-diphosphate synthase